MNMTMSIKPVIAIDGSAASGKGTLARRLAKTLGCAYMETGALYRLLALRLTEKGVDPANEEAAIAEAAVLREHFSPAYTDNPALRQDEIGQGASKVAAIPAVRAELLSLQREFAAEPPDLGDGRAARGAILDGRDIGTVVCPDADAKLFITAKTEIRAERRHKELQSAGFAVTYEAVLADMLRRDKRDSDRKTAPMKPAADAKILDTSDMTIEEVYQSALAFINEKLAV